MCVGGDVWPGPPQYGPCGGPLPGVAPSPGVGVAEQFAGFGLSLGPLFEAAAAAAAASIGHVGVVGAQGLAQGLVVGDGGAAAAAAFAALGGVMGGKQRKHTRPTFSGHQIFALEKTFEQVCPVTI